MAVNPDRDDDSRSEGGGSDLRQESIPGGLTGAGWNPPPALVAARLPWGVENLDDACVHGGDAASSGSRRFWAVLGGDGPGSAGGRS